MSKDLSLLLGGWDYNPNEVTVRRILGTDGREKIQMRLDLGVLQMEAEGRPDGRRPHGFDTLLEFHESQLEDHISQHGDGNAFELDAESCGDLRQEAMQFYHRYLSLFHLGDFTNVIRDTRHNLRLFDFMRDHAEDPADRMTLEQFRPYVLMMNTRARACLSIEERDFDRALTQIESGITRIEEFLREVEREDLIDTCREIAFLREWSERIQDNRPLTRAEQLRRELQSAVEVEDYERAAELRDELRGMVA
jgi:hypothetical protein